jgi:hypothetical protein
MNIALLMPPAKARAFRGSGRHSHKTVSANRHRPKQQ